MINGELTYLLMHDPHVNITSKVESCLWYTFSYPRDTI